MKNEVDLQIIAKEVIDLLAEKDLLVCEAIKVAELIIRIIPLETKLKDTR